MTEPEGTVRVAWTDDAPQIARLLIAEWRARQLELLSQLPDEESAADAWRRSLQAPGDARNRVLVALGEAGVCGMAVLTPATDPDCDPVSDAELVELVVAPEHRRQGHGSRLLQAAADTLSADRFTRAVCWVIATDDPARAFVTSAGWAADGAHRELQSDDSGAESIKQIRLHTALG